VPAGRGRPGDDRDPVRPGAGEFDEHSRTAQTDPAAVALYGVALATLDDDPGVRPDAHAFIVDKALWFTVTDDLPQYPARIPGQNAVRNS
jgi:hypothetical protein